MSKKQVIDEAADHPEKGMDPCRKCGGEQEVYTVQACPKCDVRVSKSRPIDPAPADTPASEEWCLYDDPENCTDGIPGKLCKRVHGAYPTPADRPEPSEALNLMDRIERDYGFQCEAGPLHLCTDWMALRQAIPQPAPASEPSEALEAISKAQGKEAKDLLEQCPQCRSGTSSIYYTCPACDQDWMEIPHEDHLKPSEALDKALDNLDELVSRNKLDSRSRDTIRQALSQPAPAGRKGR